MLKNLLIYSLFLFPVATSASENEDSISNPEVIETIKVTKEEEEETTYTEKAKHLWNRAKNYYFPKEKDSMVQSDTVEEAAVKEEVLESKEK